MNIDKENNIELVKKFQNLMQQKKQEEAFQLIDSDATWHSDEIGAPWSGIHKGIKEIKKHFANITGTTTDFTRNTCELFAYKNMVIEFGSLSCILNKTKQPFATEYVCIYKVKDDKISYYRIFEDSLKLYRAYFNDEEESLGLKFDNSVAEVAADENYKIIKAVDINKHFPAPEPGAVNVFNVNSMSVGMVETKDYPSYPHSNDYDEVHYIIKGTAKFKQDDGTVSDIEAGDIVYVKTPAKHEWFCCSSDFKLLFVQSKNKQLNGTTYKNYKA